MKKLFYILLLILTTLSITIGTIHSCDDNEYDLAYNFPFEIELSAPNDAFTGFPVDIKSSLSATYNITKVDHFYSFKSDKKGYLLNENDEYLYDVNDKELSVPNAEYRYIPLESGTHTLTYKFRNKFGTTVEKTIKIEVKNNIFVFNAFQKNNYATIGVPKTISLNLERGENQPSSTTYKYSFEIEGVKGELKDKNGQTLPQGKEFIITAGTTDLTFLATEASDDAKITFKAIDSFKQEVISTLQFTVGTSAFDFTANPSLNEILINQDNKINFNITPLNSIEEDENNPTKYQLRYQVIEGNGSLSSFQQNQWIDVDKGDFQFPYKGLTIGEHKIKFSVKNNFNIIVDKEVIIKITPNQFTLSATSTQNNIYLNQVTDINLNISSLQTNQKYQLKYEILEGDAKLEGYQAGVYKTVNQGDFVEKFKASSKGAIKIKLTAKNQDDYEQSVTLQFNSETPSFDFTTALTSNNVNINSKTKANYNITSLAGVEQTYQLKYEVLSGSATVEGYQAGVYKDVVEGNGSLNITPTSTGAVQVKLTVKNNYSIEKSQTLTLTVGTPDFTFASSVVGNNNYLNVPTTANYTITSLAGVEQTYLLKYELVSGNATIEGYDAGVYKDVSEGNGSLKITPTSEGSLKIRLTTKNNFGVEKSVELNLNITLADFQFTASLSNTIGYVNVKSTINYNIESTISNLSQTYQLKYELVNGNAIIEGYQAGVYQSVNTGNGSLNITPTSTGAVQVKLTARNNYGVEKVQLLTLTTSIPEYDFGASLSNAGTNSHVPVDISYAITNLMDNVPQTFKLKYEVVGGTGSIEGMVINVFKDVSEGNTKVKFTPTSVGSIQIKLTARNNFGVEKVQTLNLAVGNPDFQFSSSLEKNSILSNEFTFINYEIVDNLNLGQTYQLKYEIAGGNATVEGYQAGVYKDVVEGNGKLKISPTSVGSIQIKLTARNNSGVEKTQTLTLTVGNPDFLLTANTTNSNTYLNVPTTANFEILNKTGVTQSYQLKYEILSGSAEIEDYKVGVFQTITGTTGSLNITPKSIGAIQIRLTAKNNFGVERTANITLNVVSADYDFGASFESPNGNINLKSTINIGVSSLNELITQTYQLKYEVLSGTGSMEGRIANVFQSINDGNSKLQFTPTSIGAVQVKLTVRNNFGLEKVQILDLSVGNPDYTFSATPSNNTFILNSKNKINYEIKNTTTIGQQYQLKYELLSGNAIIDDYQAGIYQAVTEGNGSLNITPTSTGALQIRLTARNDFGLEKVQTITLTVGTAEFNFNATLESLNGSVNQPTTANYNISTIGSTTQEYQLKYEVLSGNATVEGYQAGVYLPITEGNGSLKIIPNTPNDVKIKLTARNNFGVEKSVELIIKVGNPDFDFGASFANTGGSLNIESDINLSIESIGNSPQSYKLKYEVLNGTGHINGYPANIFQDINTGFSKLKFIPTSTGTVQVKLTARSNYGVEKVQTITLTVGTANYNFTANLSSLNGSINNPVTANYTITSLAGVSQTFQLKYEVLSGNATVEGYQAGVYKTVSEGNGNLNITPTSSGVVKIRLVVLSSHGIEKFVELTLTVDAGSYDFGASFTNTQGNQNIASDINYSIDPLGSVPQTFKLKYEIVNGSGTIEGMIANIYQDVATGSSKLKFTPTNTGSVQIKLTARNNYGVEKVQTLNLTVGTADYNFSASLNNTTGYINVPTTANYTITGVTGLSQTYQLKYELVSGTVRVQGYDAGVYRDVSAGNGSLNITPTSTGSVKIKLTARSSSGVEKTVDLTMTVSNLDYNFTATLESSTSILNQPTTANYEIYNGTGVDQTYQLKYEVLSGNATVEGYQAGVYQATNKGNGSLNITPTSTGTVQVKLTVRNNNGLEKTQTLSLTVNSSNFNFGATLSSLNGSINNPVTANYTIASLAGTNQTYQLKYELVSGNATVEDYQAGVYKPVSEGNGNLKITPTTAGSVKIKLTARSSAGIEKTVELALTVDAGSYDFGASFANTQGNLNIASDINYSIDPLGSVPQTFKLKYEIVSGSGTIEGMTANIFQDVATGSSKVKFTPTSTGSVQIKLTARNNYNVETQQTLTLTVGTADYNFSASLNNITGYINVPTTANYTITSLAGVDQTYQLKYEVLSGNATVEGYQAGLFQDVTEGIGSIKLLPKSTGTVKIKLTVRSSSGVEKTVELTMTVSDLDYSFTATLESSTSILNQPTTANYEIYNGTGVEQTYQLKYEVLSGSATVEGYQAGVYKTVSEGNGNLKITPTSTGTIQVRLTTRNNYGTEKVQTITLTVGTANYNFTANLSSLTVSINNPVTANYTITSLAGTNQTYQLKYELVSGNATVEGYQAGVYKTVSEGNGSLKITPTTAGSVKIKLTARSSAGIEKFVELTLTVDAGSYDFGASFANTQGNLNIASDINYSIDPLGSVPQTFKLKYEIVSGSGTIEGMTANIFQDVATGSSKIKFTPTSTGAVQIKLTARNNYGVEKTQTITLSVGTAEYTFSANLSNLTGYINVPTTANYSLTSLAGTNQTYQLKYELISGNATVEGYQAGLYQDVTEGTGSLKIIPTTLGSLKIKLTARNNYGSEKSVELTMTVNNLDFNFTATLSQPSPYINESVLTNYDIYNGTGVNQTYQLKYEVLSGSAIVESYQAGVYKAVSEGTGSLKITPTAVGSVQVKLTVRNNIGIEKNQILTLTVKASDYQFTASLSSLIGYTNSITVANYTINPLGGNKETYQLKYELVSGNATVEGYQAGVYKTVSEGNGSLNITPTSTGSVKIKLTTRSSSGVEKTVELTMTVSNLDYNFTATLESLTAELNQSTNINYSLIKNGSIAQTYQLKYEILNGTGTIFGYQAGVFQDVTEGNGILRLRPTSIGSIQIKLTARNNSGVEKSQTLTLTVKAPDFNLNVSTQNGSFINGAVNNLNYSIDPLGLSAQTFQLKYEIVSGTALIEGFQAGVYKSISSLVDILKVTPVNMGTGNLKIKITARSNYGVEKASEITVAISQPEFEFTANASSLTTYVNVPTTFNYEITNSTSYQQSYQLKYELIRGNATVEGYQAGVYKSVSEGASNLKVTPLSTGSVQIKLTARNNFGVEKSVNITLTVQQTDYTFNSTLVSSQGYVDIISNANYTITSVGGVSQTYQMKYEVLNGTALVEGYQAGIYKSVKEGTGSLKITPKSAGSVQIRLTTRSNFGVEKVQTLTLNVSMPSHEFTASIVNGSIPADTSTDINYNINNSSSVSQTYEMKYEILNGSATINGFSVGNYKPVSAGNGSLIITPTSTGTIQVRLTTRNNYGVEKTQTLTINSTAPAWSFWINTAITNMQVNKITSIPIDIDVKNKEYEIKISKSGSGKFEAIGFPLDSWRTIQGTLSSINIKPLEFTEVNNAQIIVEIRDKYTSKSTSLTTTFWDVPLIEKILPNAPFAGVQVVREGRPPNPHVYWKLNLKMIGRPYTIRMGTNNTKIYFRAPAGPFNQTQLDSLWWDFNNRMTGSNRIIEFNGVFRSRAGSGAGMDNITLNDYLMATRSDIIGTYVELPTELWEVPLYN